MAREIPVLQGELELFEIAAALNAKGSADRAKRFAVGKQTDHGTMGAVRKQQEVDIPGQGRVEVPHEVKRAVQKLTARQQRHSWEVPGD